MQGRQLENDRRGLTRGRKRGTAPAAAGAVLACLALTASADANTYEVTKRGDPTPDGFCSPADCSLREAVLEANSLLGPPDKIVLPSRRPYNLSIAGDDDMGFLGDLDVTNDPVRIVHPGTGRATIDAHSVGRVFDIFSAATIEKVVITGGAGDYGGGIRAGGRLTLIRSVVSDNSATACGGGIHTQDGAPLKLVRTSVLENEAGTQGGGVSASCFGGGGPLTMTASTVARNRSDLDGPGGGGGYGGGMYLQTSDDTSTIKNSTFSRNRGGTQNNANSGGGLYTDTGALHISGSTFSRNRTGGPGGGIVVEGTEPFTMVNSTVADNRTASTGGGIHVQSSEDVRLNAVTIARNHGNTDGLLSEAGGGIFANENTSVRVRNSLLALNTLGALTVGDPPAKNDCSSGDPFISQGHNLLSTEFLCDGFDEPSDLVRARPKIGRLDRNGGPTETIALKRRSPAIGNAHKPSAPGKDQRGRKRDKHPDIGAFER